MTNLANLGHDILESTPHLTEVVHQLADSSRRPMIVRTRNEPANAHRSVEKRPPFADRPVLPFKHTGLSEGVDCAKDPPTLADRRFLDPKARLIAEALDDIPCVKIRMRQRQLASYPKQCNYDPKIELHAFIRLICPRDLIPLDFIALSCSRGGCTDQRIGGMKRVKTAPPSGRFATVIAP
jgi:hypothetical protein